ncbi:MAG: hypothetical protein R3A48_28140 [Polyangiales bacterium]
MKEDVVGADTTQIEDVVETDGGVVDTDTGVVDTDTGVVDTDTGVVDTDTGVVDTDTGVVDTDTGVVDTDTGVVDTDTGVIDTDTGMSADSGVVDTDTGMSADTGVVDTGVVDTDTGMSADTGAVTDTGAADSGITAPANDLPANAPTLNLATPVVTVMGSTTGATRQGACGAAGEVYYRFTLTRREVVSVNTYGSTYDTTVALTDAMGAQLTGACNDDSTCGGLQSQYTAVLDAGTYLVAVGGFSSNTGNFVLNFHHLPVGNGPAVQVTNTAAGVRTYTGTTSGTGTVTQSCGGGATGPENTYWFVTCPSFVSTPIQVSTCGGASWDTVAAQLSTNRTAGVCNDDGTPGCGVRSRAAGTLAAGAALHAVYVDGYNGGNGAYSVAISFGACATGQNLCSTACRDLQSDPTNCGNCGTACAMGQTCSGGVCRTDCPTGQTNCSGACVNTATNIANCGACGRACTTTNGTPSCVASACGVASCNAGYGNCDSNAANGCETNTGTSVTNCGACGRACSAANGTASCTAGSCGVAACNTGYGNCDGNAANGCEVNLRTSVTHCGACGNTCTAPTGGSVACTNGACVQSCPAGQSNCGGVCRPTGASCTSAGTGGCATTGTIICSGTTTRCSATAPRTSGSCTSPAGGTCNTSGTCVCATGQTACSGTCRNLQTDNNNCGACGRVCGAVNGLATSCSAGVCRPINDTRASAVALTLSTGERTVTGSNTNATFDGPTGCGTNVLNVWYRVTLTAREILYADTAGSAFDTRLYLVDSNGALVANTCNDDAGCSAGGFTSTLQSRFAAVLNAGTYYIAVAGFGSTTAGNFTLHVQHISSTYGSYFYPTPITGTATTTSTVLVGTSARTPTCTVGPSGEDTRWFMTCGAQTSLFSLCPRDGATWTRAISGTTYDASMYVYSGQSGTQSSCNDDGGTDCAGTGGDTLNYGSRIEATMNRGINMVVVDERTRANGMRYTMRHIIR